MRKELLEKVEKEIPEYERKSVHVDGEEQRNWDAIVERGGRQALAMVTKRYVLVQTREVFRRFLEACPEDVDGTVDYYRGTAVLTVFPAGLGVGASVVNSVDKNASLQMRFVWRAGGFNVYLPPHVAGVRRIHVGRVSETFGDLADALAKANATWQAIVETLSRRKATEEDLKVVAKAAGKKCGKAVEEWFAGQERRPDVWRLVLKAMELVAARRFKSPVRREERMRRLSAVLLAHALGTPFWRRKG